MESVGIIFDQFISPIISTTVLRCYKHDLEIHFAS